ncbi:hypothetical protein EYZ11_006946 [Aspergillus tanneri]|uniref:Uncharacterized protein n=1 Tax=Aspergillus tanneri TaxID=1220188 RepID=A0A4S3JE87_9EURO|nr:hypothetical protein EYZ11_006946 [Aspergillus tanneri]
MSQHTPWREKRLARGPLLDPQKAAKADRERFRRRKIESYKQLNDVFLDGLHSGRERRVYVLIMNRPKGAHGAIHYSTYNSHPRELWVPTAEEVAEHTSKIDKWDPSKFEEKGRNWATLIGITSDAKIELDLGSK